MRMVRREDTVARIGGDEFVVLIPDLNDPRTAGRIAAKIVEANAVPIPISDGEAEVSERGGVPKRQPRAGRR
jgi:GGDEF domain-containing protein